MDGYVLSNDGGGAYRNLLDDVQCTVGLPHRGKHKLNTWDGGRQVRVVYNLDDARAAGGAGCTILDDTISPDDRNFSALTEINTQTQGNLFTIQKDSPAQIPMYIDIKDTRAKEAPQRITWGGEIHGTSCGPAPLISCDIYNGDNERCEKWTIEIAASEALACFGADAGPIKPAASNCAIAFKETVEMLQP